MGQVQSEEYQLDAGQTEDVADSEINSTSESITKATAASSQTPQSPTNQQQPEATDKNQEATKSSRQQQATKLQTQQQKKRRQEHVRKLSNVSHRNIQLLSMKARSEKEAYADDLKTRRRSSLINLILGAPSSGPRFCDDLCSLNSNFGIEFLPDTFHAATSIASLRLESIEDGPEQQQQQQQQESQTSSLNEKLRTKNHRRRRSSVGSISSSTSVQAAAVLPSVNPAGDDRGFAKAASGNRKQLAPSAFTARQHFRQPSITSTLASIDLTSSFEQYDKSSGRLFSTNSQFFRPPLRKTGKQSEEPDQKLKKAAKLCGGIGIQRFDSNQKSTGRVLRRTGSELSLYSTISANSGSSSQQQSGSITNLASGDKKSTLNPRRETKLIIMLQVCLPFILAGFGNMAAGLVLNKVSQWRSFNQAPIFFVLLPPFIGLKGNIEMTLASRLSTLSNLNLLDTGYQRRRAYVSNLILIMSQAIGLSCFAATVAIVCELIMTANGNGGSSSPHLIDYPSAAVGTAFHLPVVAVFASALMTSIILVTLSSFVMSLSIVLANYIQVNPDNLSTLIAALYGDVSCVLVYGLISNFMFIQWEQSKIIFQAVIISSTLLVWPVLLYMAYKFKETHGIALSSIPPMLVSIVVSMGSGAVLSLVVSKFKLIALYQPVVNGFGANLIAVQASRVSTWLWCSALRRLSITASGSIDERDEDKVIGNNNDSALVASKKTRVCSLASSTVPDVKATSAIIDDEKKKPQKPNILELMEKFIKTILWSFFNSSPNSIAARLLLIMMIPAHTIYFFVIWILSPTNYIVITWQFYLIYIGLSLIQVFILLTICEPLMTFLMNYHMDPDIFGISILMALADLLGTLCLTGAFFFLSSIGDPNTQELAATREIII